ncbi:DUF1080 domain-containing protein [Bacteroides sp.]|uniref:3-keto-disaccharide hydrolase n=1 Tax=Bacteroides sp. TaxID=29523 RepID=UPI002624BF4B|nr:DUF1080 domain-containing protein [Bacteroides sp.]MDD3039122.1 DUF1080 domain-containing protein [Bacteroides sp.]
MKQIYQLAFLISILFIAISCNGRPSSWHQNKVTNKISPEFEDIKKELVNLSDFPTDKEGFICLFDGKSLKGWRGYGKNHLPEKWSIDNETLVLHSSGTKEGGDIIFASPFKNFELELEWKISKGGNSGIFYLAREIMTKDINDKSRLEPIYMSALEYQILDDENHPDAKLGKGNNRISGSLYDIVPAIPQNAKPFEKWNKSKIIVNHGHLIHQLNGEKVVECQLWTSDWKKKLQESKFSETKWPLAFELMNNRDENAREGYIGLQDHGHDVWFRHIRIKNITE